MIKIKSNSQGNETTLLDPNVTTYAGLGVRSLAFLLDLIFLGFLVGVIEILVYGEASPVFGLTDSTWGLFGLYFIVFVLYFGWTESSRSQASIGKLIMDLKVVNASGNRISFFTSVYRYLLTLVCTISLGLGFIPALTNTHKTGWHDKVSKTFVVHSFRNLDDF
jgi:uncharacterized RDD family membrane protein YckC